MEYTIMPEKTAIVNGVSLSCKEIIKDYQGGTVLDYGCGKLRNSKHLIKNHIKIDVLDTKKQIEENIDELNKLNIDCIYTNEDVLPKDYYEYVLLSFVLNVIPEKEVRVSVLNNIKNSLKDKGFLYLEVRNNSFIKNLKSKISYNDGYITGSGSKKTFQKPYTLESIEMFLKENNFNILKTKKTSGSIFLICKKEEEVVN